MREGKNRWPRRVGEKYECERCGWEFLKSELLEQDGLLVCEVDYDEPSYQDAEGGDEE